MGTSQPSRRTRLLKSIARLAGLIHAGCWRVFGAHGVLTRLTGGPQRLLENLRILSEGRDRYNRYQAGRRRAAQGAVVLYDRYPLEAVRIFDRIMDGPRIAALSREPLGPITRRLARVEEALYRRIRPPDHVFVLRVAPEVSQARKRDHDPVIIRAKSQAISQIARDGLSLIDIDAEAPLEQVLLQIKTALWRLL
jgi:hypothetical protein